MLFTKCRERNQMKYEYEGCIEICWVHRRCDALARKTESIYCFQVDLNT